VRQAADLHKKLFENANSDWRANDIAQKVAEEKQREMDLLLNRYLLTPCPVFWIRIGYRQCFGSEFIESGSGSGHFGEFGSRSRFVSVEKNIDPIRIRNIGRNADPVLAV
jgi:hypothetical protein